MATWPSTLGYPESDGYRLIYQEATEQTEMTQGPPIVREVRSEPESLWRVSFKWRDWQWALADYLYQNDWGRGSVWIEDFPLYGPAGLELYDAQIRGVPEHRYSDAFPGTVTITVATRTRNTITADEATFLAVYDLDELEAAQRRFSAWFAVWGA